MYQIKRAATVVERSNGIDPDKTILVGVVGTLEEAESTVAALRLCGYDVWYVKE